jgi:hypothetical protein
MESRIAQALKLAYVKPEGAVQKKGAGVVSGNEGECSREFYRGGCLAGTVRKR